jgi:hypothetical protein
MTLLLASIVEQVLGYLPSLGLGVVGVALVGLVLVVLLWAIGGAILGRDDRDELDDTLEAAGDRTVEGFDTIFTFGRVAMYASFAVAAVFAEQLAMFAGDAIGWLLSAPVVAANLLTIGVGIASFELGIVEISFTSLAVILTGLTLLAVGIRRSKAVTVRR